MTISERFSILIISGICLWNAIDIYVLQTKVRTLSGGIDSAIASIVRPVEIDGGVE